MKTLFIHSLFVAFVLPLAGVSAQETRPDGRDGDPRSEKKERRFDREGRGGPHAEHPFFSLSDEEREKVRIAMSMVWQDPELEKAREKVKLANDAHREALKAAILKTDPEVRAILEKVMEPHLRDEPGRGPGGEMDRGGMSQMSKEDWEILASARKQAMETDVMKGFSSEKGAESEDWRGILKRSKEFRDALHGEMVKIDPRVAEIAKKLPGGLVRAPRGEGPAAGPGRGPREPKRPDVKE